MRKTIKGEEYRFTINHFKDGNVCYFDIETINLQNKTHSFITNLNCILSEFNVDIDNSKKMESQWEIKEKERTIFFKKSVDFISNERFRKYLEKQLNLDQELGEWNKLKV